MQLIRLASYLSRIPYKGNINSSQASSYFLNLPYVFILLHLTQPLSKGVRFLLVLVFNTWLVPHPFHSTCFCHVKRFHGINPFHTIYLPSPLVGRSYGMRRNISISSYLQFGKLLLKVIFHAISCLSHRWKVKQTPASLLITTLMKCFLWSSSASHLSFQNQIHILLPIVNPLDRKNMFFHKLTP